MTPILSWIEADEVLAVLDPAGGEDGGVVGAEAGEPRAAVGAVMALWSEACMTGVCSGGAGADLAVPAVEDRARRPCRRR